MKSMKRFSLVDLLFLNYFNQIPIDISRNIFDYTTLNFLQKIEKEDTEITKIKCRFICNHFEKAKTNIKVNPVELFSQMIQFLFIQKMKKNDQKENVTIQLLNSKEWMDSLELLIKITNYSDKIDINWLYVFRQCLHFLLFLNEEVLNLDQKWFQFIYKVILNFFFI
jgi:hypothetical protein